MLKPKKKEKYPHFSSDTALNTDIAIIGMACRFPGAANYQQYWKNLTNGFNCIQEVPPDRWDINQFYSPDSTKSNKSVSKWGGFLEDIAVFDAAFFNISPREAILMDPQQRILLELSWTCFEEAGYQPLALAGSKTGVFIGACNFDYKELLNSNVTLVEGHVATGTYNTMLANRLSYFYDFRGPSLTLDAACASSLFALNQAVQALRLEECSLALAGGISILCTPTSYISFSKNGMLSSTGQCHSFEAKADGYVRGEGAGLILLKPLSQALKDGDQIEGIIKGVGVNHGGRARTLTSPNPYMQAEVIQQAWKQANVNPNKISYIEAHGTGTPLGDPIEILGLQKAFKKLAIDVNVPLQKNYCGIGTVKTSIGHLESAAGIAGIIKVLLAFRHGVLPSLQNFQRINPKIELEESPFYLVDKGKDWQRVQDKQGTDIPRYAGVSSFGFGGANAHIALQEGPSYILSAEQIKPIYLLALSAKHPDSLKQKIEDLYVFLKEHSDLSLEALAYTLNVARSHFNNRCSLIVSSLKELREKLKQIQKNEIPKSQFHESVSNDSVGAAVDTKAIQRTYEEIMAFKGDDIQSYRTNLETLANLYVKGYDIDWEILHQREARQKIRLPTYPFLKKRYWINEC